MNGSTTINVDFSSFIDGTAVTTQVPGVIFSLVGGPDASGPPTKGYGLLLNATQGFVYPTANILRATFVGIATNISFNFTGWEFLRPIHQRLSRWTISMFRSF